MEEKKKELFTYFTYLKSVELFPEKYGNISSMDEWTSVIQENEDDINTIITAWEELTDEDLGELDKQYAELQSQNEQEQMQFAAKGAKLRALKAQSGMKMINPYMKDKPEYIYQRAKDSMYHSDYGIKRDLKEIINERTFSNPSQIRSAENFGYVGTDDRSLKDFANNFMTLYNDRYTAGSYDGKVAATDEYMKGNKMQLPNQDVVKLAERIKKNGGKTKWTESSPMYGDESYDLTEFLNKVDIYRVMRELERQNNPGKTQAPVNSKAKGGTMKKKKKCKCGCDMVISKAAGGKLTETCACKCGGKINK